METVEHGSSLDSNQTKKLKHWIGLTQRKPADDIARASIDSLVGANGRWASLEYVALKRHCRSTSKRKEMDEICGKRILPRGAITGDDDDILCSLKILSILCVRRLGFTNKPIQTRPLENRTPD